MVKIYIYFFISILIHELTHIFIARIFNMNLKNLRVSIFGASLEIEKNNKNKIPMKILMYFSGPCSNLLIAILIYNLKIEDEERLKIIYTNLSLCVFNLLPIYPLDGGNILKEVLKLRFNNLKSNKIGFITSKICLSIITFIYSIIILKIKNISIFILIIYLWYLNFIEEKKLEILEKAYNVMNEKLDNEYKEKINLYKG